MIIGFRQPKRQALLGGGPVARREPASAALFVATHIARVRCGGAPQYFDAWRARHGGGPAHPFGCPSWTVPPSFDEPIGCIFDRMLDVILVEDGGLVFRLRAKLGEPGSKFFLG